MLIYLPERIHNILKDKYEFKEFLKEIESTFIGINSLVDCYKWLSGTPERNAYIENYLQTIIDEYIPDNYLVETYLTINGNIMSKDKLLEYYYNTSSDDETRLFALYLAYLSSYRDGTFFTISTIYTNYYESIITEQNRDSFSDIIHLKYIELSFLKYINNNTIQTDLNILEVINKLNNIYEELSETIEKDILDYGYLNNYLFLLNSLSSDNNNSKSYELMSQIIIKSEVYNKKLYFSYIIPALFDAKFNLAIDSRDFLAASIYLDNLVRVIDNSLGDINQLLSTLLEYNKDDVKRYILLLRKLLSITRGTDIKLTNLKNIDRDFLNSDFNVFEEFFKKTNSPLENSIFFLNYENNKDWLNGSKEILDLFKEFYNNDYQIYKNNPNFNLDNQFNITITKYENEKVKYISYPVYPLSNNRILTFEYNDKEIADS